MDSSMYTAHILIVDDQVDNIHILGEMLSESRYRVGIADGGEQALEAIQASPPDLIFLDIMMPGMGGFEICRILKSSPLTKDIPIIFLTAQNSVESIQKGFELGAVDYITKPFQQQEVLVRANSQISLLRYQKRLKSQKRELEEINRTLILQKRYLEDEILNRKRAELSLKSARNEAESNLRQLLAAQNRLMRAERRAGIGNLVMGVAHQINTPLGIGVSESSYLEDRAEHYAEKFRQSTLTESDLRNFFEIVSTASASTLKALQRAARLMTTFKRVSVDQIASNEKKVNFQLKKDIENVASSFRSKLKARNISVTIDCADDVVITSYPLDIYEILTTFLTNSLEHGFEGRSEGEIWIHGIILDDTLLIRYRDNGIGVDKEEQKKIFDPFYTTSPGKGSFGLGLHIVYNMVTQKLHGEINCLGEPGRGTEFIIEMPLD